MENPAEMGGRRTGERASSFSVTCRRLSQYLKERGSFGDIGLGMEAAARRVEGKPETLRTLNLLPGVEASSAGGEDDGPGAGGDAVSDLLKPNPSQSMDLFPRRPGLGAPSGNVPDNNREPQIAPMTIFYGGKVVVFDNFPADKAKELMDMAGRGCRPPVQTSPVEKPAPAAPVALAAPVTPPQRQPSCPPPPSRRQHASTSAAAASETVPVAGAATVAATAPAPAPAPAVVEEEAPQKTPPSATSDLPIARRVSLHRFLEKRKDRITAKAPYQVNTSSGAAGSSSAPPAKGEEEGPQWLGLGSQPAKKADLRR